jgi:hypothetical protein
MQMKEMIRLTGLLLETNQGASLPTRIKACFNAMETSQFTFNQKLQGYVRYATSWEGYAYRVLGFSGSPVSPFSEAW